MIQKAIEKIDKEMEQGNGNLKAVANYIIDKLLGSEENAEKILDEKKSLKGCFSEITSKAKKQAENNCAMIDDQTVFAWVREYFGVEESEKKPEGSNIFDFDIFAGV